MRFLILIACLLISGCAFVRGINNEGNAVKHAQK